MSRALEITNGALRCPINGFDSDTSKYLRKTAASNADAFVVASGETWNVSTPSFMAYTWAFKAGPKTARGTYLVSGGFLAHTAYPEPFVETVAVE